MTFTPHSILNTAVFFVAYLVLATSMSYANNDKLRHYKQIKNFFMPDRLCPIEYNSVTAVEPLLRKTASLPKPVIETVLMTLRCRTRWMPRLHTTLTIIDYSIPSNQKRLWVFDLREQRLLFHTFVSHGITSGTLETDYFSNKYNSKATSLGVFRAEKQYYGRHGLSLRLQGLERGFNHNAMRRNIVMHAAWYVNQDFIDKYGRVGRSWGCPAVPKELIKPIIKTIRNNSLFVVYYPADRWILKSHYLTCKKPSPTKLANILQNSDALTASETVSEIVFVDRNNNKRREESDPVLVMDTDTYQAFFKVKPPLRRMLRRQINNQEYIALNQQELRQMDSNLDAVIDFQDTPGLFALEYVVPIVLKRRGYYKTQFKPVFLGRIESIKINYTDPSVLVTNNRQVKIRNSRHFIRWLGL